MLPSYELSLEDRQPDDTLHRRREYLRMKGYRRVIHRHGLLPEKSPSMSFWEGKRGWFVAQFDFSEGGVQVGALGDVIRPSGTVRSQPRVDPVRSEGGTME